MVQIVEGNVSLLFLELGFPVKKQTGWSYDYRLTLWIHLQKRLKKHNGESDILGVRWV